MAQKLHAEVFYITEIDSWAAALITDQGDQDSSSMITSHRRDAINEAESLLRAARDSFAKAEQSEIQIYTRAGELLRTKIVQ